MKRPSFQMYAGDWLSNPKLARCGLAEIGGTAQMMCTLNNTEVYGLVRWPLPELARAARVPLSVAKSLVAKGILKGCDSGECQPYTYTPRTGRKDGPTVVLVPAQRGPIWFIGRMVRDEHIRRSRAGDLDETPNAPPNSAPKAPISEGIGPRTRACPSSSSSSSSASKDESEEESLSIENRFPEFWDVYPRKVAKGAAEKAFAKALSKATADTIIAGAKTYADSRKDEDPKFTKHAATWLNAECWADQDRTWSSNAVEHHNSHTSDRPRSGPASAAHALDRLFGE